MIDCLERKGQGMDDCRATVSRWGRGGGMGKQRAEPVAKSINNWMEVDRNSKRKGERKEKRGKGGERIGIGRGEKEVRSKKSKGGRVEGKGERQTSGNRIRNTECLGGEKEGAQADRGLAG